jgi:hypothetical protein
MTTNQLDIPLRLPITQTARITAEQFAQQQPTSEKANQVRLNTLAVFVVNDYLQMMGTAVELTTSDIWNPVMRMCADVADLNLPGLGRLECRPVSMGGCYVPPETWEERIGYVAVQIDEVHHEANLLGFVKNVVNERLPISQLQPMEAFIDYLAQLQSPFAGLINLSQWVTGMFSSGWESVESLWNEPVTPGFAFRGDIEESTTIQRAKLINLGIQINNQLLMLIVEVSPDDQQNDITLRVHPTGNEIYLPFGVTLTVLDETDTVFLEAQARDIDNYIQLQFRGSIGERFGVKLSFNDASVVENFVI